MSHGVELLAIFVLVAIGGALWEYREQVLVVLVGLLALIVGAGMLYLLVLVLHWLWRIT